MTNPWAGEVALTIDGAHHAMKLTLGSLAELEAELQAGTLVQLIERFEQGQFSTRDVLALVVAGLRGGGWQGQAGDLISAEIEGGPVAAARAAGLLLRRAFAMPDSGPDSGPSSGPDSGPDSEAGTATVQSSVHSPVNTPVPETVSDTGLPGRPA